MIAYAKRAASRVSLAVTRAVRAARPATMARPPVVEQSCQSRVPRSRRAGESLSEGEATFGIGQSSLLLVRVDVDPVSRSPTDHFVVIERAQGQFPIVTGEDGVTRIVRSRVARRAAVLGFPAASSAWARSKSSACAVAAGLPALDGELRLERRARSELRATRR
jgi:hypothetical protein